MFWNILKYRKDYFEHFVVFLLLASCGNPLFTNTEQAPRNYIFLTIFLIAFVCHKGGGRFARKFLPYGLPMVLLFFLQSLVLDEYSFTSLLFIFAKLFIGAACIIGFEQRFFKLYVNVMTFLAFVSLFGYFGNLFFGFIEGIAIEEENVSRLNSLVLYTQIYYYGELMLRNSGMFWEPGAFQGYICIAFVFLIKCTDLLHKKLYGGILTIALITTFSTTGYIVFAFIVIYYTLYYNKVANGAKIVLFFLIVLLSAYAFYNLDFLGSKISIDQSKNLYEEGRLNDFFRYSQLIFENLFFGIGPEVGKKMSTGNGLLSFLMYGGLFVNIFYYVRLIRNVAKQVEMRYAILLLSVVLLSLLGEGFLYYPLYLALPLLVINRDTKLA